MKKFYLGKVMARFVFYTGLVVGDAGIISRHYSTESEEISMSDYLIETKQLTKTYGDQAAVMVPLWTLTSSFAMERLSPFPLADREWSH